MGKILIVAEKPSAGADIAKVVGATDRQDGYIEGNNYIVTWAVGHLVTLKEPQEHNEKYAQWLLEDLPLVFPIEDSLKIIPDSAKQFKTIKNLIHRQDIDYLINAGDAGREGYLIQEWIYRMAGCQLKKKVLWASSLTTEGITTAMNNLKDNDDIAFKKLLTEAEARAEADYILGMNYSRLLTLTRAKRGTALSYGRCQTPLLNMIVTRDHIMENFVPKPFWDIVAEYSKGFTGTLVDEDHKIIHFMQKEIIPDVVNKVSGKPGVVKERTSTPKYKKAPLLYNLAALQQEMGKKYKYSPDYTLKLCQSLYEKHKMLSYPRTDSRHLSTDIYNEVREHICSCSFGKFKEFVDKIDFDKVIADKSYFNDLKITDHHALIPTINPNMEKGYNALNNDEKNVFDAVVLSFIAIFYPPYKYQVTEILIDINGYTFLSKGNTITDLGYKLIYKNEENSSDNSNADKENEEIFPEIVQGEYVDVDNITSIEKKTKSPGYYNDSTIITAMEKYGIGTSATRAEIIKKLMHPKREFITRNKDGIYKSTELGQDYISIVPDELKAAEFTKHFEEGLSLINSGKITKKDFLNAITKEINSKIIFFSENELSEDSKLGLGLNEVKILGKCPKCNSDVKTGKHGPYCSGKCGMNVSKILGVSLTNEQIESLLKGQKTRVSGLPKRAGGTFSAYILPTGTEKFVYEKDGVSSNGYQYTFKMEFPERKGTYKKK